MENEGDVGIPKKKCHFINSGQPVASRGIDTKYRTTYNTAYGGLNRLRPFKKPGSKMLDWLFPVIYRVGNHLMFLFYQGMTPPHTIDCPWSNSILELGSLVKQYGIEVQGMNKIAVLDTDLIPCCYEWCLLHQLRSEKLEKEVLSL